MFMLFDEKFQNLTVSDTSQQVSDTRQLVPDTIQLVSDTMQGNLICFYDLIKTCHQITLAVVHGSREIQ